jgi:Helix-turn-helix domain
MDTLHDEGDAARYLSVSPRTLQRWRVEGRGPKFLKLGKRVAYAEGDLIAFVNANRHQSTSEPSSR